MRGIRTSRLVRDWATQIFLASVFTTLLLFVYLDKSQTEMEMRNVIEMKKKELKEHLRTDKIKDMQRSMFLHPDRPKDERYNLNVTRSESIPLERNIPDSRPEVCLDVQYDREALSEYKTTVIIPFYNEALSMVLRAVHSILMRTPKELLSEIILVDDHSPNKDLHEPLEEYVKLLDNVYLIRMSKREGLIRARLTGAARAKGTVIMFQDAHTENNEGWLEPMLEEIRKDKSTIVQPSVDQIEQWTLEYIGSHAVVPRGGYSWDLRYTWMEIPEHERLRLQREAERSGVPQGALPFRAATLVGCALAAHKDYFLSIGGFDDAMEVWGGENIELAWRNWMCGGRVLTHPCSRVGHVFKPFAYSFDGDREKIVQKNLMRIAEVWMDKWKKYFLAATYTWQWKHTYFNEKELESLEKRRALKRKLQCKGFDWYLKEITPEIPTPDDDAVYYGEVANEKSEACFAMAKDDYLAITYFCFFHRVVPENLFHIDFEGRLMYMTSCLRIEHSTWLIKKGDCEFGTVTEKWSIAGDGPNTGLIQVEFTRKGKQHKMCVAQVTNIVNVHYKEQMPQLMACDANNEFMHWRWTYHFTWDYNWGPPKPAV